MIVLDPAVLDLDTQYSKLFLLMTDLCVNAQLQYVYSSTFALIYTVSIFHTQALNL